MAERSIPVRGIAVFEAAARAVSFHAAAEELNLTPSAVSHQIRLLEETLGVKLFERVGRGVTLTAEGAEYARSVRPSIRRLRAATNQIKSRAKKGGALEVVRIEIPPSLAHCWLLPRLAELIAQHRGIQLRSVKGTIEGNMDIQGILGIDSDVRNGFGGIKVVYDIDADAKREDIEALVAQSQKRSAVYDIVTNPTNVTVVVN